MSIIQVRAQHVSFKSANADVAATIAQSADDETPREIRPRTAVTIASWWQSPGSIGKHLAAFASGAEVDRSALLDDIAATRGQYERTRPMPANDRDALDCLATFVIHHAEVSR